MDYNINLCQLVAIANQHTEIDLNDFATLNSIANLMAHPKTLSWKSKDTGEVFYWVSVEWIQTALPMVYQNMKPNSVYKRMKKLEQLGYIVTNKILSQNTGKTFIRLGEKSNSLIFPTSDSIDIDSLPDKVKAIIFNKKLPSEKNPNPLGNFSEPPSENFPNPFGKKSEQSISIDSITIESIDSSFSLSNSSNKLNQPIKESDSNNILNSNNSDDDFFEDDPEVDTTDPQHGKNVRYEGDYFPEGARLPRTMKGSLNPKKPLEKAYPYLPFNKFKPDNAEQMFRQYYDENDLQTFKFKFFDYIDWGKILGPNGEEPFDLTFMTPERMDELCKDHGKNPRKIYTGVEARTAGQYVHEKFQYVNVFSYKVLADYRNSYNYILKLRDSVPNGEHGRFKQYWAILDNLYREKKEKRDKGWEEYCRKNQPPEVIEMGGEVKLDYSAHEKKFAAFLENYLKNKK